MLPIEMETDVVSLGISPFDSLYDRYDAWYDSPDGRPLFEAEMACLRLLTPQLTKRWVEIGVGTGRFAQALGVRDGVDVSEPMLRIAANRGVRVAVADAKALPYADATFDGALMIATLCFLDDPVPALRECARVLRPAGVLLVGIVPADSPWGCFYVQKAREGHPFYSVATFYTCEETMRLAEAAGFAFDRAASTLLVPPNHVRAHPMRPQLGIVAGAGFVVMQFSTE